MSTSWETLQSSFAFVYVRPLCNNISLEPISTVMYRLGFPSPYRKQKLRSPTCSKYKPKVLILQVFLFSSRDQAETSSHLFCPSVQLGGLSSLTHSSTQGQNFMTLAFVEFHLLLDVAQGPQVDSNTQDLFLETLLIPRQPLDWFCCIGSGF